MKAPEPSSIRCPACGGEVFPGELCSAGVRLGWVVATWVTRKGWRRHLAIEDFDAHSLSIFAFGQALHAWEESDRPAGALFGTDDAILLQHQDAVQARYGLRPATREEVARVTATPLVACEFNAERANRPVSG